ncbi:MAG: hypothetical protein HRU18_26885 [Pseudoalteromonas sp.]|uniref:hypothetical protein n=1 Tax=Pseudoalteromonas sp. TaxID=53249 RepID=UPI001D9414A0|nr:hypothetical protein [Pseudoalteromonas sp.]NRA81839.1 hypothetical protein [Pseudoalteromonas sp.]
MKIELYKSIREIPLFNWEKLNETGDYKFLVKDKRNRFAKLKQEQIEEAYFSLHDEYADATDSHDRMIRIHDLMVRRIEARERVGAGEVHFKNFVDAYDSELEQLMKPNENYDPIKSRMRIQQHYGQPIKPKEITLYEYLMIVKVVEEDIQTKNQNNNGKGNIE